MTELYQRPDSPFFWVTFVVFGKRYRRSTGCEDRRAAGVEGRRIRREVERASAAGRSGLTRQAPLPVGQAGKMWLAAMEADPGYSASYRRRMRRIYELHIRGQLGSVDARTLTPERLRTWRDALSNGQRKAATINRIFAVMRTFCRWLVERGHLPDTPCRGIKPLTERTEERHRALPDAVLDAWCGELRAGHADTPIDDARRASHVRWIRFLCETGLRQSEGYALRRAWVDVERRCINLPATACKGAKARQVPLTGRALAALGGQGIEGMAADALIWGRTSRRTAMEHAWARTGLPGRVPTDHDFRHTAASLWISAGASLAEVQGILGHATPITTARYMHLYGNRSARLAARIDAARVTSEDTTDD